MIFYTLEMLEDLFSQNIFSHRQINFEREILRYLFYLFLLKVGINSVYISCLIIEIVSVLLTAITNAFYYLSNLSYFLAAQ